MGSKSLVRPASEPSNPDVARIERATRDAGRCGIPDAPVEPFGEWYLDSLWDDLADDAEYLAAISQRFSVD